MLSLRRVTSMVTRPRSALARSTNWRALAGAGFGSVSMYSPVLETASWSS